MKIITLNNLSYYNLFSLRYFTLFYLKIYVLLYRYSSIIAIHIIYIMDTRKDRRKKTKKERVIFNYTLNFLVIKRAFERRFLYYTLSTFRFLKSLLWQVRR